MAGRPDRRSERELLLRRSLRRELRDLRGAIGIGVGGAIELSALDGTNGFALNGVARRPLGLRRRRRRRRQRRRLRRPDRRRLRRPIRTATTRARATWCSARAAGFAASLELSALDGSNGFALNGVAAGDYSGRAVAGAGDVNGDGFDDLIVGAYAGRSERQRLAGQSYVVFGASGGFGASLELSALDGSNGFALNGVAASDYSGRAVAGAGDVNGDGFDDLIVGAPGADPNGDFRARATWCSARAAASPRAWSSRRWTAATASR
jgi:hypothetical protein